MFTHRIEVSQEQILKLQNYKESVKNYIFDLFDKQINEPNYYLGYIIELLKVDFQEYNQDNRNVIAYLTYRLHEDKEYKNLEERLQIGL
jgi:hypothetical protein